VEVLVDKSEGRFIHAATVFRDYCTGNKKYSVAEIEAFPHGLNDIYVENFGRIKSKNIALFPKIKSMLELLVAMLEPLPVDLCQQLIECTDVEMEEIKNNLCYLFPVVNNRFTVYHKSVVDFLTDRRISQKLDQKGQATEYLYDYYSDKVNGHVMMSNRVMSRFLSIDSPLSLMPSTSTEYSQGVISEYLYGHFIGHMVHGGFYDEAKVLLLRIHWSIGVLRNRSNGIVDLQKQYELVLHRHSDLINLDESVALCYKSIVMSSSYLSSLQDAAKLTNAFVLNQIGRLSSCELVNTSNCPMQVYLNECRDWWRDNHKYVPHMFRLPSPEGKYRLMFPIQNKLQFPSSIITTTVI
jgi:hypothetical protein